MVTYPLVGRFYIISNLTLELHNKLSIKKMDSRLILNPFFLCDFLHYKCSTCFLIRLIISESEHQTYLLR